MFSLHLILYDYYDLYIYDITIGKAYSNAFFGEGYGPIYANNVQCIGNEASLLDCTHTTEHRCSYHSQDSGVSCAGLLYINTYIVVWYGIYHEAILIIRTGGMHLYSS